MSISGASNRGTLFALGGPRTHPTETLAARYDPSIFEEFLRICGGPSSRILVLTAASQRPEQKQTEYGAVFEKMGIAHVTFLDHRNRQEAEESGVPPALDEASGVFIIGGNQLKLVTSLGGTRLLARLRERYESGLHVAGTSAGASALSSVMIAAGRPQATPRLASVRLTPGLGFMPDVIIDQHFIERDRFGRLMTAVLCNSSMLGIGLDENTAFALDAEDRITVVGKGTVTIIDGSEVGDTNVHGVESKQPVAFTGLRVHGLRAGWVLDLKHRRVEKPLVEDERVPGAEDGGSIGRRERE